MEMKNEQDFWVLKRLLENMMEKMPKKGKVWETGAHSKNPDRTFVRVNLLYGNLKQSLEQESTNEKVDFEKMYTDLIFPYFKIGLELEESKRESPIVHNP